MHARSAGPSPPRLTGCRRAFPGRFHPTTAGAIGLLAVLRTPQAPPKSPASDAVAHEVLEAFLLRPFAEKPMSGFPSYPRASEAANRRNILGPLICWCRGISHSRAQLRHWLPTLPCSTVLHAVPSRKGKRWKHCVELPKHGMGWRLLQVLPAGTGLVGEIGGSFCVGKTKQSPFTTLLWTGTGKLISLPGRILGTPPRLQIRHAAQRAR